MLSSLIANSAEFRLSGQTRAELRCEKRQLQYKALKEDIKECVTGLKARSARKKRVLKRDR
jgi:hypothetical protein